MSLIPPAHLPSQTYPLILAPMAGFSDLPLRALAKRLGADLTVSEMISANALVFENQKTKLMLQRSPAEQPFIAQIAGGDVGVIKRAAKILDGLDFVSGIDFNCGCPVNKVIKQCAGSALLADLDLLKSLVQTIRKHSSKSVSVKFRLGYDEKRPEAIARACEEAGADFIAVHGRTRTQMYRGRSDYAAIARAGAAVKIPLIANGDIDESNAHSVRELTGAAGLMIGRASIGRPWIFWEIKNNKPLPEAAKRGIILEHFESHMSHYGAGGVSIFRKQLHAYAAGRPGAAKFRDGVNHTSEPEELRRMIEDFF